jgi:hypothetical protein
MTQPVPAQGEWRLTVRRLGPGPGQTPEQVNVVVQLDAGGGLTAAVAGRVGDPGRGTWRSAGPGRLVLVVEWLMVDEAGRADGLLVVRAAAELFDGGRRCWARLLGQRIPADGRPLHRAVAGEASGTCAEL